MEVERRVGRSSLSRGVVVPVRQDPMDGGGLSDESDDFHLGSASAGQRVDVIDFVDELRPSFAHRAFRRGRFSFPFSLVLLGVATMRHGGANAVGIGPIEVHEMLVGLGDVDEHAREELERLDQGIFVEVVPGSGFIHEQAGSLIESQSREVDGCSHEIAGELVHAFGVCGIDGGVVVDAEIPNVSKTKVSRCALRR